MNESGGSNGAHQPGIQKRDWTVSTRYLKKYWLGMSERYSDDPNFVLPKNSTYRIGPCINEMVIIMRRLYPDQKYYMSRLRKHKTEDIILGNMRFAERYPIVIPKKKKKRSSSIIRMRDGSYRAHLRAHKFASLEFGLKYHHDDQKKEDLLYEKDCVERAEEILNHLRKLAPPEPRLQEKILEHFVKAGEDPIIASVRLIQKFPVISEAETRRGDIPSFDDVEMNGFTKKYLNGYYGYNPALRTAGKPEETRETQIMYSDFGSRAAEIFNHMSQLIN